MFSSCVFLSSCLSFLPFLTQLVSLFSSLFIWSVSCLFCSHLFTLCHLYSCLLVSLLTLPCLFSALLISFHLLFFLSSYFPASSFCLLAFSFLMSSCLIFSHFTSSRLFPFCFCLTPLVSYHILSVLISSSLVSSLLVSHPILFLLFSSLLFLSLIWCRLVSMQQKACTEPRRLCNALRDRQMVCGGHCV